MIYVYYIGYWSDFRTFCKKKKFSFHMYLYLIWKKKLSWNFFWSRLRWDWLTEGCAKHFLVLSFRTLQILGIGNKSGHCQTISYHSIIIPLYLSQLDPHVMQVKLTINTTVTCVLRLWHAYFSLNDKFS